MSFSVRDHHRIKQWDRKHVHDLHQSFSRAAAQAITAIREGRPDEPVWAFPEAPWSAREVIKVFKLEEFI